MSSSDLRFPYMFWAQSESTLSAYCLSQSGMPAPDASFLAELDGTAGLGHPAADALPRLEARLAELFGVAPERMIVTVGASAAMTVCALRWFEAGARVVSEVPSYDPVRALPARLGADCVPIERRLDEGWSVDPERVRGLLAGARPGHLFLTNPHNPTGTVFDADHVRELARVADDAGGVLVSCEVYMEYATNQRRVHAAHLAPNAVSIGSLTKAYGLGPLRIGWIVLGEGLVQERDRVRDAAFLAYVDPPTLSLLAAHLALDNLPRLLEPLRRVEVESRPHLWRWLRETEGVQATIPELGIIAFPRLVGIEDTHAFQRFLAREFDVDVVPGEFFGRAGHVRVGCGVPEATLVEGLVRLGDGIRSWRERGARG